MTIDPHGPAESTALPFSGLRVIRVAAGPQLVMQLGDGRSDAAAGSIAFSGRWRCGPPGQETSGEYDNAHAADATTLLGLLGAGVEAAAAHPDGTLEVRLVVRRSGSNESWRLQVFADPGAEGWVARVQGVAIAGRDGLLSLDRSAGSPAVSPPG